MQDTTHLNALQVSLSNERSRLAKAKTNGEVGLRSVWCKQLEKEIADERKRIGLDDMPIEEMSDDVLLAFLGE